jgi:calcineurin-like phosphoesterase family protein
MNPSSGRLVRPMFDGPVDIVGDIHGEIEPLLSLLDHLGYDTEGNHPDNRRLIFLGDLIDRGPDSPGVVAMVQGMVERDRAQCIMGNHELNLLRGVRGNKSKIKPINGWYFDDGALPPETRETIRDFFESLPLALERPDLRAVHACWQADAIDRVRLEQNAADLFLTYERSINQALDAEGVTDKANRELAHQNDSPIKVLTSGPEQRATQPWIPDDGRPRWVERVRWFDDYDEQAFTAFGHYSRVPAPREGDPAHLFEGYDLHHTSGNGNTICLDYSIGAMDKARRLPEPWPHPLKLGALRWPERQVVFHDGGRAAIECRNGHDMNL